MQVYEFAALAVPVVSHEVHCADEQGVDRGGSSRRVADYLKQMTGLVKQRHDEVLRLTRESDPE